MSTPRKGRPFYLLSANRAVIPVGGALLHGLQELQFAEMLADIKLRRVGLTKVGRSSVSTVFIGRNFRLCYPPLVFETAIMSPQGTTIFSRTSTWRKAEADHKRAVAVLKRHQKEARLAGRGKRTRKK